MLVDNVTIPYVSTDQTTRCQTEPAKWLELENAASKVASRGMSANRTAADRVTGRAISFCGGCPFSSQCLEIAELSTYTGVAGGQVVYRGAVVTVSEYLSNAA